MQPTYQASQSPNVIRKDSLGLRIGAKIWRRPEREVITDRAMEAWSHPSIARMTPNRRVTWQATSNDENS